jgi:hypothetical protein
MHYFLSVLYMLRLRRGGGGSDADDADAAGWWADGAAETEICLAGSVVSGRHVNEGCRDDGVIVISEGSVLRPEAEDPVVGVGYALIFVSPPPVPISC